MDPARLSFLLDRWARLLTALRCPAGTVAPTFADLHERYTAPERHYHSLDHIHSVLETIQELNGAEETPALLLAAWFHDVVYDSKASDNEGKSAAHARQLLRPLGVLEPVLAETERLILLTKTHTPTPEDRPGAILVDADLAILSAAETQYDAYAQAIRREYAWVSDDDYRGGRCAVLERFLQRPRIYATEEMLVRAETAARENMQREIATLN
jgi:predicted metal-dependent HD superfamily phosphohydrolase